MIKYILLLPIIISALISCAKSNIVTIDHSIKSEVLKNISDNEFSRIEDNYLIYSNRIFADFYENDSLKVSTKDTIAYQVFKSYYYWQADTLRIEGTYGIFGGVGFSIKASKNDTSIFLMLASDEFPQFSLNADDSLVFLLDVPCKNTKIVLSEIPDSLKKQTIYGYVEFSSNSYFHTQGSLEGKEILPRVKGRNNMKIYFKCKELKL